MINYHPTPAVLQAYVRGELAASVSIIVASHLELCERCRRQVAMLTEEVASQIFMEDSNSHEDVALSMLANLLSNESSNKVFLDNDALDLVQAITEMEPEVSMPQYITELEVAGKRIALPRAIKSIALSEWKGIGKVSRSRLALEDNNLKASLLHIDRGGAIPTHTHKGYEITLLLQGSFKDEMGEYHEGDFIWLDGEHHHSPVTEEGCVCLTVSSDALHFTKGLSQLINPLGKFLY